MICWEIDSIEEAREKDGQVNPHMERMTEMEENKRMREKERHHDQQRYIYMCIERERAVRNYRKTNCPSEEER